MTFFRFLFFTLSVTACFACKHIKTDSTEKIRRVTFKDVIAEGDISSDTIYNGLIKFYDRATNKLVIEAYYKTGKLDGRRKSFYLNGKIKNIAFYENGMQNGTVSYFDSTGKLASKQDSYYDLLVGNHIEYENGKPSKYYFTSFDEEDMFYINYDSVKNREIKKINNGRFFFWHARDIFNTDENSINKQFFIYIINPPNFHFQYSLCIIDNRDSILRTEKMFDSSKIWDTFILDQTKVNAGERYALRLAFDRSLNDGEGEYGDMLKKL